MYIVIRLPSIFCAHFTFRNIQASFLTVHQYSMFYQKQVLFQVIVMCALNPAFFLNKI